MRSDAPASDSPASDVPPPDAFRAWQDRSRFGALDGLRFLCIAAVLWHHYPLGAALADLPDEDWQHMICIEAAQVDEPVILSPGQDWAGMQSLTA